MKLIFVSGPYRGDIEGNIARAREAAVRLWKENWAVICPHLNSARMDGECPDDVFLQGDLEILRRCDAIYLLKDWVHSEGARAEFREADRLGLEIVREVTL